MFWETFTNISHKKNKYLLYFKPCKQNVPHTNKPDLILRNLVHFRRLDNVRQNKMFEKLFI